MYFLDCQTVTIDVKQFSFILVILLHDQHTFYIFCLWYLLPDCITRKMWVFIVIYYADLLQLMPDFQVIWYTALSSFDYTLKRCMNNLPKYSRNISLIFIWIYQSSMQSLFMPVRFDVPWYFCLDIYVR